MFSLSFIQGISYKRWSHAVFFSMHLVRYCSFICPTTDDIRLDCLIKVESEGLFHGKVTFFSFIVHKYFAQIYFKAMEISCSSFNFQFMHSLFISVRTHNVPLYSGVLICFFNYFDAQIAASFASSIPLKLDWCIWLFFVHTLAFGTRCFGLILHFPCPIQESAISPSSPGSF